MIHNGPHGDEPIAWHTAIIMRAGILSMESYAWKSDAIAHLRRWYADLLTEQDPDDRPDLIAEFGDPETATVDQMSAFYGMGESEMYWCDVVPVEQVLNRILPTLTQTLDPIPHAAVVLDGGTVAAHPCPSYDDALTALRHQACEWDHDPDLPDPATASIEQLAQACGADVPGQWFGIMPILHTEHGPSVLIPIDHLPATI